MSTWSDRPSLAALDWEAAADIPRLDSGHPAICGLRAALNAVLDYSRSDQGQSDHTALHASILAARTYRADEGDYAYSHTYVLAADWLICQLRTIAEEEMS